LLQLFYFLNQLDNYLNEIARIIRAIFFSIYADAKVFEWCVGR